MTDTDIVPGFDPPERPPAFRPRQTVQEWRHGDDGPQEGTRGQHEPEDEDKREPIDMDRAYQWERLCLRVICYALYLVGVIGGAWHLGGWQAWALVIFGGLVPVAYLLVTESHERLIEDERRSHRGERRAGDLPHLRRAAGSGYDDDADERY